MSFDVLDVMDYPQLIKKNPEKCRKFRQQVSSEIVCKGVIQPGYSKALLSDMSWKDKVKVKVKLRFLAPSSGIKEIAKCVLSSLQPNVLMLTW